MCQLVPSLRRARMGYSKATGLRAQSRLKPFQHVLISRIFDAESEAFKALW